MFCSSHIWFLVTISIQFMKIRKYFLIFVYIFQGKMEKIGMKIMQLKWPKYPKQKTKIWDEQNIKQHKIVSFFSSSCMNVCTSFLGDWSLMWYPLQYLTVIIFLTDERHWWRILVSFIRSCCGFFQVNCVLPFKGRKNSLGFI